MKEERSLFKAKSKQTAGREGRNRRLPADAAPPQKPPKRFKRLDTVFVIIILALLTFGVIMVFSSSYPAALHKTGNSFHFISKHVIFVVVGLIAMFVASFVDYHVFRRFAIPIFIVGILLLILVLIPGIGSDLGTFARRWIVIGSESWGINFQPSEIMKFAIIIMFAHLAALLSLIHI